MLTLMNLLGGNIYQLAFIPRSEDAFVQKNDASVFSQKVSDEFGYDAYVEPHPYYHYQYVVYVKVNREDIDHIVNFMKTAGFGSEVAEQWWLNSVRHLDKSPLITGIQTDTIPVSDWIDKLP